MIQNEEPFVSEHETQAVEIDWRYIQYRRTFNDITVMTTWNFAREVPDACLILAPTYGDIEDGEEIALVVIEREDAWRWSRTHNNDREMVGYHGFGKPPSSENWQMANATYYAMMLNLSAHEPRTALRIRGLIEDHIDDLLNVPPAPEREGMKEAVFTLTDLSTGSVTEASIKDT